MKIIEAKDLSTKFGDYTVHDKINFHVDEREIYGLLGGSGSGKTTLLREMILLQKVTSGSLNVLGYDVKNITSKQTHELQMNWGVLFQYSALFTSLTILENVASPLKEYTDIPKDLINEIAMMKIAMSGLPPKVANQYPSELSGGMKKRAGLARALALDPKVLFLDEPTSGLDPASAREFDALIMELRDLLNLTVVMVTHDKDTMENVLDRFVLLGGGKAIMQGNFDTLKNDFPNEFKIFME